jgi:hypothetical protein
MSEADKGGQQGAGAKEQDSNAKGSAAGGDQKGGEKAPEWKPLTREETEKLTKELAETRKEAAERRVAAKKLEDEKADAERKKAEADGNIQKIRELDKKEIEDRDKKLAELTPKAQRAEKLEAAIKNEVEALEKELGEERAQAVAHLDPVDRLPILKQFAVLAAGPGATQPLKLGKPGGSTAPVPLDKMTPDQQRQYFLDNPKAREEALQKQRPARVAGGF